MNSKDNFSCNLHNLRVTDYKGNIEGFFGFFVAFFRNLP